MKEQPALEHSDSWLADTVNNMKQFEMCQKGKQ